MDIQIVKVEEDYLEITLCDEEVVEEKHLFFLQDEHFLTCFTHPQNRRQLYFDIHDQHSLAYYLKWQKQGQGQIKKFIKQLDDALSHYETGRILTGLDHIFLNEASGGLSLICLPIKEEKMDIEDCFITILKAYLHDVQYSGKNEWLSQLHFLLEKPILKKDEILRYTKRQTKKNNDVTNDFFTTYQHHQVQDLVVEEPKTTLLQNAFKTTELMNGYHLPYLVDDQQAIHLIELSPFMIGRGENCSWMIDSAPLSKQHCMLYIEDDGCFIEDLHSTNGTYVNGVRLQPGERCKLLEGDTIQLALLKYEFHT